MSDIKVFKTITGEDIISEVIRVEDTHYILKDPAVLVLQDTEAGMRVGLAPYMPYAKQPVALYAHAVSTEAFPEDVMVDEYKRVFSPIVTQPQSIIMPK